MVSKKRIQEIIDNQGKAIVQCEKEILQAQIDMEKEDMEEEKEAMEEYLRLERALLG